jgi:hypothetical protein
MRPLHDRMPMILEPNVWPVWLGKSDGNPLALMRPAADHVLRLWPVSRAVNNLRNNGAALLDSIDDPAAPPPSPASRLKLRPSIANVGCSLGWTRPARSNYVHVWQDQSPRSAFAACGTSVATRRAGFPCLSVERAGMYRVCPTACCCGVSGSYSRLSRLWAGASVAGAGRRTRRRGRQSCAIRDAGGSGDRVGAPSSGRIAQPAPPI